MAYQEPRNGPQRDEEIEGVPSIFEVCLKPQADYFNYSFASEYHGKHKVEQFRDLADDIGLAVPLDHQHQRVNENTGLNEALKVFALLELEEEQAEQVLGRLGLSQGRRPKHQESQVYPLLLLLG